MIPIAKPYLGKEEAQAAYDTVLSGWVTQGPRVAEFETAFVEYTGAKHAVAVSNCTTALHLALVVAGVKAGDEVICPSMSYIATANAIVHAGATPVFAEVNKHFNIDIEDTRKKITSKTKAILIVHQVGMPADIDAFKQLCEENNLLLIEDAACAIGSSYKGRKIGQHSDLVCFSFHPRKVITTGDGGMITTNNAQYYDRLKKLRQHAMSVNDLERHKSSKVVIEEYPEVGYNYRMTDIQAAVGIHQLARLDWILSERRKLAQRYHELFSNSDKLILPLEEEGYVSNYQSYCITLKENVNINRDDLMQYMLDNGISTRRAVMCIHNEKAYNMNSYSLPITESIERMSIIIPLFIGMTDEEQKIVVEELLKKL